MGIQQIIFWILIIAGGGFAFGSFSRIRRNILLGNNNQIGTEQDTAEDRWRRVQNMVFVAFGQKKMFKRWLPAVLHGFIYVAFLMTQVELIEILIDGALGIHRFFAPLMGSLYTFIIGFIEVLSLLAFVATIVFLARRNLLKIPRFHKSEMTGWPKLDGNLILYGEIILLIGIFSMNGADVLLQKLDPAHYPGTGTLPVSSWLGPMLFGGLDQGALVGVERFGWWLHLIMVLVFLNYLPYSKHLHILLAFPNTYYAKLSSKGEMENMPEIMNEVKSMMGLAHEGEQQDMSEELPEFGANDVTSLSWKNILDAYSCTECGRCTAVCPANLTGKKLSPRKIMMDIRDRADEIGKNLDTQNKDYVATDSPDRENAVLTKDNYDDGKSLFDYISKEEIHACTTCNACVEACPVLINPLEPILKLRRYEILTLSEGPSDWVPMFTSLENSGSAWAIPDARDKWAD